MTRRVVITRSNSAARAVVLEPFSSHDVYAAIGRWMGRGMDMFDKLAYDRFCEAVAGESECDFFGELCDYLGVSVTWDVIASQGPLW